MSAPEIAIILVMMLYALYKQSVRLRLNGPARFRLPTIYGAAGLLAGGFHLPPDAVSWALLAVSLGASVLVGVVRGRLTRVWRDADGSLWRQGTPLTIGLYLLLVAGKFALGAWQTAQGHPHGGFGEVLLMIAAMVALQAEIVWRRGRELAPHAPAGRQPGRARLEGA